MDTVKMLLLIGGAVYLLVRFPRFRRLAMLVGSAVLAFTFAAIPIAVTIVLAVLGVLALLGGRGTDSRTMALIAMDDL